MENRLKKLLEENKVRLAKKQLVDDLFKYHGIDFSGKEFVEYQVSEKEHKKVYERISKNTIKSLTFPFQEESVISKIEFIFEYFKKYENSTVMFYPSTSGFHFRRNNQF